MVINAAAAEEFLEGIALLPLQTAVLKRLLKVVFDLVVFHKGVEEF